MNFSDLNLIVKTMLTLKWIQDFLVLIISIVVRITLVFIVLTILLFFFLWSLPLLAGVITTLLIDIDFNYYMSVFFSWARVLFSGVAYYRKVFWPQKLYRAEILPYQAPPKVSSLSEQKRFDVVERPSITLNHPNYFKPWEEGDLPANFVLEGTVTSLLTLNVEGEPILVTVTWREGDTPPNFESWAPGKFESWGEGDHPDSFESWGEDGRAFTLGSYAQRSSIAEEDDKYLFREYPPTHVHKKTAFEQDLENDVEMCLEGELELCLTILRSLDYIKPEEV